MSKLFLSDFIANKTECADNKSDLSFPLAIPMPVSEVIRISIFSNNFFF